MAELSTWPVQNSGPTGVLDSREAATHIGGLVYPHTSILKAKAGFRPGPGTSPGLVSATGTPDGFVHVAPFELLMQNIRGSGLGVYIAGLDAIKDINILSTPADPTNPRDDLIVAQQSDIFDGDANSDFLVRHVVGTPGAIPADPSISGSTNVVALARVRVAANATTITGSNITDLRTTGHAKSLIAGLHTVALGGILPVASQAERDALTGIYHGMAVWRTDKRWVEIYDATVVGWSPPPGTILARHRRITDSSLANPGIVGIVRLDNLVGLSGYAYEIKADPISLTSNAGDVFNLTLRISNSGVAGTGSTAHQSVEDDIASSSAFTMSGISALYVPAANETWSVLLCLQRMSGGGSLRTEASAAQPLNLTVTVKGKDPGSTGTDI